MNDPARLRVLVVDDFEPLRKIVRAVLSKSGSPTLRDAVVAEAADLSEARTKLSTDVFDVVILDLSLPDGSGFNLIHELTAAPPPGGMPVVLAASGDAPARPKALEAGCADFLLKPYSPDELVEMLAEQSPVPVVWG